MNPFDWLPTAVALVVFLGASVVYLRGARDKGTILTLEQNAEARDARINLLERAARDRDAADLVKDERISALEQQNLVLQNTVNSSELIKALGQDIKGLAKDLTVHHGAAMAGMVQIHEDLETVTEAIKHLKDLP